MSESEPGGRRWPAPPVLIGGALLLVAAVLAWFLWPRDKPDLVIVGDSVTFLSIPSIERGFEGDYDLDIRAYPGQATNDLVLVVLQELVERDEQEGLEAMALLVGYNDVLRFRDRPAQVAELVDLAAGAECTVVFTVPAPPNWSDQDDLEEVRAAFAAYNELLTVEVGRHPDVHLDTSWQEAVESSEPGELVDTDGVHPIEKGQDVLADAFVSAVNSRC